MRGRGTAISYDGGAVRAMCSIEICILPKISLAKQLRNNHVLVNGMVLHIMEALLRI
jgi:hypothetical protein